MTSAEKVIIRGQCDSMPDCHQEETGGRIIFHLRAAIKKGATTCCVDTNVIVLAVGKYHSLKHVCPILTVWMVFGTWKIFSFEILQLLEKTRPQHFLLFMRSRTVTVSPRFVDSSMYVLKSYKMLSS